MTKPTKPTTLVAGPTWTPALTTKNLSPGKDVSQNMLSIATDFGTRFTGVAWASTSSHEPDLFEISFTVPAVWPKQRRRNFEMFRWFCGTDGEVEVSNF
jgi:hypothetical protein